MAEHGEQAIELLADLVGRAKAAGADAADALLYRSLALSVTHRLGKPEDLQRAESQDLGLRVFIGQRQAFVASNDFSRAAQAELVERAVAMARATPEDRYCGLAEAALLAKDWPELDLDDAREPAPDQLYEQAAACEAAALAVPGVSNSEEAGASFSRARVSLVTSHGFAGGYGASSHGFYAAVLAGQGTAMERDYEQSHCRHAADLEAPEAVGRRAGERAVARLDSRKAESRQVPVVFDPRVSRSLLGHLIGAISGPAVARGTSFLKDRLGTQVFAPGIRIVDDPHRRRGLASRPFDGEGVRNGRMVLVEDGVLRTWILDSSSARQLGLRTTGHASRGTGGPPGPAPSNLYLEPGPLSPEALLAEIDEGFYVTELIGFGVNPVTGDYSRGAVGFWIENGRKTYAVSESTIAGNLQDIFRRVTPANDLVFRYASNAPTCRIDGLTVAGR
ncbi:MAG: TldD/PmbA family protein [Alphaproteobacteria bacterium]|nr:TldD/PmbA family protein [Alphaproteobacteria bacterium]